MNSFRQICDKPCTNEILHAEWSPMRDLIAIVTSNGDVRLHRLYWQKVWVMLGKSNLASRVAWKPDGKLLAVGYDDGSVSLVEIEKAVVLYTVKCTGKITSLHWSSKIKSQKYSEFSKICVPFVEKEELQLTFNNLNILINTSNNGHEFLLTAGCENGFIYCFAEGIFPVLAVNACNSLSKNAIILNIHMELTTGMLTVAFKGIGNNDIEYTYLQQYSSTLLSERSLELFFLSNKLITILTLICRCEKVINRMKDASEDVCFRISTKLEKLEEMLQATGSTVACVFTAAYATGETSPEMETFLTQHLTIKGLKQISQSVHSSYLSLQADISEELEVLLQHLLFHLVELSGMENMLDKFGLLGVTAGITQTCLSTLHQLIFKTRVLLQVVCNDMNNFRIFFVWLVNFMFSISDEENPAPFKQFTNEEFDVMIEFLEYRLLKVKKNNNYGYDLERVSQFFHPGVLDFPDDLSNNAWYSFISSSDLLKNSNLIIKPNTEATLLNLFNQLKDAFDIIFGSVKQTLTNSLSLDISVKVFEQHPGHDKSCISSISFLQKENALLASVVACSCGDSNEIFLLKVNETNSIVVHHCAIESDSVLDSNTDENYIMIKDAKFYNLDTITVLFEEVKSNDISSSTFGQLALNKILNSESIELASNYDGCVLDSVSELKKTLMVRDLISELRLVEGFSAKYLCVNGYSRKVCCLIAVSGRRVRIFDMTAEDDDDKDNDDPNESQH